MLTMKVNIKLNKQEAALLDSLRKKLEASEGRMTIAAIMRRGMVQLAKSNGVR